MILLVDDRPENLFSLSTILAHHGFAAETASSGEEALKKVLKRDYALIILDVQMPGMDGFEVAEAIAGLNKTKDIPIIFLSAVNTHKSFITKGFESGAVEYLTKPVDPDILMLKVRNFYQLYEKTHALKDAQKALTQTVTELYGTLEALPQLAFTTNLNGELEYVNNQWLEFAASNTEFPESSEGASFVQKQWNELIEKNTRSETEVHIKKLSDQQYYYHLLRASPVLVNGQITRWVGTLTSIHEQKRMNEVLEQKVEERTRELSNANRELEISNLELQQFTSVASHDLKEPLRKIRFFGSILVERAQLDVELKMYLEKIIRSSRRMNDLINDLLSFASLSTPTLFQPTHINRIIEDTLSDLELNISEKKAVIKVDKVPVIEAVPGLVQQLLQNLLSNALKFSRADVPPHITITSSIVTMPLLNGRKDVACCRITVTDNGIGFDEVYKQKIFTLFQRLHSREEYEGTGIGLAIAKKIVEKHSGEISAESVPGQGSSFTVLLPLQQHVQLNDSIAHAIKSQHS